MAYEHLRDQQKKIRTEDEQQDPLYHKGDKVWLQNKRFRKGTTPKLQPKYNGPYLVEEALPNHTYRLKFKGKTSIENEGRLKLFSPTTSNWGQAPKRREITRQPPRPGPKNNSASNSPPEEERSLSLPPVSESTAQFPSMPADPPATEPELEIEPEEPGLETANESEVENGINGAASTRRRRAPRAYDDYVLY